MSQLADCSTAVDSFPTLKDFSVDALKGTDLEEGVVHQIASARTVNTQHGQSTVLSLQREDVSCCFFLFFLYMLRTCTIGLQ